MAIRVAKKAANTEPMASVVLPAPLVLPFDEADEEEVACATLMP